MAEVVAIKPAVADGPVLVSQDKGILRLTLASHVTMDVYDAAA